MPETLVEFKNVTKRFGEQVVLKEVNIHFNRGEVTTVIGKSGTGKTVILKHIIGLMEPDSGEILFENHDIAHMGGKQHKNLKSRFGYMFQNVALFDSLNVYDNVALPLRETTRLSEKEIEARVMDKLDKLEIRHAVDKFPAQISGGMQKRVGMARALITDPEVVLFDEPTTGLDPLRKNAVFSMISHMQRKFGFTAIIVSHDIPEVFYISQKIAMLDNAEIILEGTPEDITRSTHPVVKEFIQGTESLKDELTGLKTKTHITKKFETEFKEALKTESFFSIILFRIDGLEEINEMLGFSAGQKVLQHFARFVESYLRISGENSRYSDELILTMLPNTKLGMAKILKQKLEQSLKNFPPPASEGYRKISYSISAGVAEAGENHELDDVVKKAEDNMSVIGYFELS